MKMTDILMKTNGSITITTFDNGYGVETSGRDHSDSWATSTLIFTSLEETLDCVREIASMRQCD